MVKKIEYSGSTLYLEIHFSHLFTGHGTWVINCNVHNLKNGVKKDFKHRTHDSLFIDELSDMFADDCDYSEISNKYYNFVWHKLEDEILEFFLEN